MHHCCTCVSFSETASAHPLARCCDFQKSSISLRMVDPFGCQNTFSINSDTDGEEAVRTTWGRGCSHGRCCSDYGEHRAHSRTTQLLPTAAGLGSGTQNFGDKVREFRAQKKLKWKHFAYRAFMWRYHSRSTVPTAMTLVSRRRIWPRGNTTQHPGSNTKLPSVPSRARVSAIVFVLSHTGERRRSD